MNLLLASAVDLAVVLGAALAIVALLRRQSAALRHAVLAAAVLAGIALPALEATVPPWNLPFTVWSPGASVDSGGLQWATSAPIVEEVAAEPAAPTPLDAVTWTNAALVLWAAGALATVAGLVIGFVRLRRLSARATRVRDGGWHDVATELSAACRLRREVALLQSDHPSLLVTFGIFRSTIVLPAGAAAWPEDRRRVVIAHELAHIRRGDWFVQLAAEALRAIYWFNPLTWIACRRLREESEYACDDAVLRAGVEPTTYATHLLAVARLAAGRPGAWASAPAIAHRSSLERRIAAMLTGQQNRSPLTRHGLALACAAALAITIPTAALGVGATPAEPAVAVDIALASPAAAPAAEAAAATASAIAAPPVTARRTEARMPVAAAAQQTPAALSGTLLDPSGAVLPGVMLSLTDLQFGVGFSAVSDATGSFGFRDLAPGRYQLDARLPGFTSVSNVVTLAAGGSVQRRITLPLGKLQETIFVVCSTAQADNTPAPARSAKPSGSGVGAPSVRDGLRRGWGGLMAAVMPSVAAQELPRPVRIGGQIKAPAQIKKVNPQCPPALLPPSGSTIVLTGRIGVDGLMNDVRAVPGAADNATVQPEFIAAAVDAVNQWGYTPTLLNGSVVDVEVTVTIRFAR